MAFFACYNTLKGLIIMKPNFLFKPTYSYRSLPDVFYENTKPMRFNDATFLCYNHALSDALDINSKFFNTKEGLEFLLGQHESLTPLSMAYAGHQYGNFTILGDGRAHLITELIKDDIVYDIHLKGSGVTPYSRGFDGRATLRSALLEYLMSHALDALNIPTTKTLAVIKTGDQINRIGLREAAVLVRVAKSHLRVGTFEYAVYKDSDVYLKPLVDYAIKRHDKDLNDQDNRYLKWYKRIIKRQAELVAKWQSIGFVHGVMNTDNMTISGETIDFGPCAFIDTYDLKSVYSSIDHYGRYAYGNQPYIASWNLAKLGQMILPLIDIDKTRAVKAVSEALETFSNVFESHYYNLMTSKIGIETIDDASINLVDTLLGLMEKYKLDYTNTFIELTDTKTLSLSNQETTLWLSKWTQRLKKEANPYQRMQAMNPFIIPRNDHVKTILDQASETGDLTDFNTYLSYLKNPFERSIPDVYRHPTEENESFVTYCGT
jgi:uncharacterized protein YdiU (UPF0061 family)